MSANDKQVGGDHYRKASVQHWDLLHELGYTAEYYVGQATKYITRWRSKHGIRDLRKGQHFVEKLIELCNQYGADNFLCWPTDSEIMQHAVEAHADLMERYFAANESTDAEIKIISELLFAYKLEMVEEAKVDIENLIIEALTKGEAPGTQEMPVEFEFLGYEDEHDFMRWRHIATGKEFKASTDELPSEAFEASQ